MAEPHVLILGGGPAGCGAAWRLRRLAKARVTLVEQASAVGGNAGSFGFAGQWVDYGSHRLHAACDPEVLADIRHLLGDDLRRRERHGRIRLRGRWIRFPLRAVDLLSGLDWRFSLGATRDLVTRLAGPRQTADDTFAAVLLARLGPTICEGFYFPYAKKIWGREAVELSAVQARRRVSATSFGKLLRRAVRPRGGFFYPRHGFGQLSEAYAAAARAEGADVRLRWQVDRLRPPENDTEPWVVTAAGDGEPRSVAADRVWSTLPVTRVVSMLDPPPPGEVRAAAREIDYRAMILVYLQIGVDRFCSSEVHYFPEPEFAISRLSEPKSYFGLAEPPDSTVLCAELPCSPDDAVWTMPDDEVTARIGEDLARAGIPLPAEPRRVTIRRLRHAYPIYSVGYEERFAVVDSWLDSLPRFLSYGRQGLFAHDNTHHALYMAYCAVSCLRSAAGFDRERWQACRRVFATHVVED